MKGLPDKLYMVVVRTAAGGIQRTYKYRTLEQAQKRAKYEHNMYRRYHRPVVYVADTAWKEVNGS